MTIREIFRDPQTYSFEASPGGSLIVGSNTVTLAPVPAGVNASDTHHYLRISGGTGTAETVLITGGTAVAGASTGTLTFTCANTHSGGWTLSSATSGVQEAIQAGRAVRIPAGNFPVYAPIFLNVGPQANVVLKGVGKQVSVLYRADGYQGDIIQFDQSVNSGMGATLSDFTIENGGIPVFNNTAGAAINIKEQGQIQLNILNIRVHNGWNGLQLGDTGGAGNVVVENYEYLQEGTYAALYSSNAGIIIGTTSGAGSNIRISNALIQCGDMVQPYPLVSGIMVRNVDGAHITNSYIRAKIGIYFLSNSTALTNVYVSNTHLDDVDTHGILFSGTGTISSIAFTGGSINGYTGRTPRVAGIDFDNTTSALVEVTISGVIINGFVNYGVRYRTPSTGAKVALNGCKMIGNGDAATGYGVFIGTGARGLSMNGGQYYTVSGGATTQTWGIGFQGAASDISVVGVDLSGNDSGPVDRGTGALTNFVCENNIGISDVIPTVASATTIFLPLNPVVSISGTTTITTMNGGWAGRQVRLIKADASNVTVGGGGNVPNSRTLASGGSVGLPFDGTNWY